jgi:hypothetical protein
MERASAGPPAVAAFVLAQLRALRDDADRLSRATSERPGRAALAATMDRLRHRLAAHVLVVERLVVSPLRGSISSRDLAVLRNEHDALEHRAAEIQDACCPAAAAACLGRVLLAHITNEDRIVRAVSSSSSDRLSTIPSWRAEELFECAGGPTESWPGEWLG